jgi:GntR family transcriptional regulator, transcriptional repressor for pyruvate dehydrogenase complex
VGQRIGLSCKTNCAVSASHLTSIIKTGIVASNVGSGGGSGTGSAAIQREQASLQLRKHLCALALRGELKPGDRLPTERQLARELCISRATLREGIIQLTTFGVLKSVHGVGTSVADDLHYGPLEAISEFYNFPVGQIFETRLALEPEIAALAAKRATRPQIADLGEQVACLSGVEVTPGQLRVHDIRFHGLVALACGNPILSAMMDGVTASDHAKDRSWEQSRDFAEEAEMHNRIYLAIRSRDPGRARMAMEQHLRRSRAALIPEPLEVVVEFVPLAADLRGVLIGDAV